jgi:uncharacterized membrane protein
VQCNVTYVTSCERFTNWTQKKPKLTINCQTIANSTKWQIQQMHPSHRSCLYSQHWTCIYVYQQGGKVDMIIAFGRKKKCLWRYCCVLFLGFSQLCLYKFVQYGRFQWNWIKTPLCSSNNHLCPKNIKIK